MLATKLSQKQEPTGQGTTSWEYHIVFPSNKLEPETADRKETQEWVNYRKSTNYPAFPFSNPTTN